jgi:competence protein ComEA
LGGLALLVLAAGLGLLSAWTDPGETSRPLGPDQAWVKVGGLVERPGLHGFPGPPSLVQLLARAGGRPELAGLEPDRIVPTGQEVRFESTGPVVIPLTQGQRFLLGLPLDLNLASQAELTLLPLVGPERAARIAAFRRARGGFRSVEELSLVPGLGRSTLERFLPLVTCEPPAAP